MLNVSTHVFLVVDHRANTVSAALTFEDALADLGQRVRKEMEGPEIINPGFYRIQSMKLLDGLPRVDVKMTSIGPQVISMSNIPTHVFLVVDYHANTVSAALTFEDALADLGQRARKEMEEPKRINPGFYRVQPMALSSSLATVNVRMTSTGPEIDPSMPIPGAG